MALNVQEFKQRMRYDRAFRLRILAARKEGTLTVVLVQEGYKLELGSLDVHLPQVRTGLRGGQCYCLISAPESQNE